MCLMRREWSGIIKNRQWGEFEAMAKTEPSQALADTVAELERGLSEKADRRALRKVLYILAQAGYEPQEISEQEPEPTGDSARIEIGYMSSADPSGVTLLAYGCERDGWVRSLSVGVRQTTGIIDAFDRKLSKEEASEFGRKFFASLGGGIVECAVPPTYALSRIAEALDAQKDRVPQSIAYWRATLEAAPRLPHPSASLRASETTPQERQAAPFSLDAALGWHLEMGSVLPMLQEIRDSEESGLVLTPEQRKERYRDIFAGARTTLFSPELVADHALRLRDLAYILSVREHEDAGLALATALDLEARGAESDYAKGLLEKTVAMLLNTWKESKAARMPSMRRFR